MPSPFLLAFVPFVLPTALPGVQCQADWIPTFGPYGTLDNAVHDMEVFDDGGGPDLYLVGQFYGSGAQAQRGVARWNGTGFSPVGAGLMSSTGGAPRELTVFDDGSGPRLYAAGGFPAGGGLLRLVGNTWQSVSGGLALANPSYPGESPWVNAIGVCDLGSGPALYVQGFFDRAGGLPCSGFARWDGTAWSAVAPPPYGGSDLIAFDDGSGMQLWSAGYGVARLGPGGWSDVTLGFSGAVVDLEIADLGTGPRLYAAGAFGPFGIHEVVRWNGAGWDPLGAGLSPVHGLGVYDFGSGPRLLAQGTSGGQGRLRAWDGMTWTDVPGAIAVAAGTPGSVRALQGFDDGTGMRLFAGGEFARVGGEPAGNVARFDGSSWEGGRSGLDGGVNALLSFDDGTGEALYVGGNFGVIDGVQRPGLARWDGSGWSSVGPASPNAIHALTTFDDGAGRKLWAGGGANVALLASWDGQAWTQIGSQLADPAGGFVHVRALCEYDDGTGNALFVGGQFVTAGGIVSRGVAKWDGSAWSGLAGGVLGNQFGQYVNELHVHDDGTGPQLYVGGAFLTAGGLATGGLARWDGTSWSAVGTSAAPGIQALATWSGPAGTYLYAAGWFFDFGGVPAPSIARWNGSSWSALDTTPATRIQDLLVFDDGTGPALFAASNQGPLNSLLAKWDDTSWTRIQGGGSSLHGEALAIFDDGTTRSLALGGTFAHPDGDVNLTLYGCDPVRPVSFCAGDGSATACPCGNAGAAGHGCASSVAQLGARLNSSGTVSVAAADLRLAGSQMPNAACLYFQGSQAVSGGLGAPFGDGLRCAGGTVVRLGTKFNSGGASGYPGAGDPSIAARGGIPAGGGVTRTYQCWYRNSASFCTPSTFNLTNGLSVDWQP